MLLFVTAVSVVLVVSFLCSIFKSFLLSLTRPQVELMVRKKKTLGSAARRFQGKHGPIAAILILNTAAHTIGAAVAGASYSSVFDGSTLWVFSILFTIAVLRFTAIIPKTLGIAHATALARPIACGIDFLVIVLRQLVWASERISRSLRSHRAKPVASTAEIRLLASLGRIEGVVGHQTAEMIVGATQLRHLNAHDVMLPREEVRFLCATMGRDQALKLVRDSGHSRFPFSPTPCLSDFTGVVLAKDLLHRLLQCADADVDLDSITKEILVVPASAPPRHDLGPER